MKWENFFAQSLVDKIQFNTDSSLWSNANAHNHAYLVKVKLESTEILEVSFFVYIFWFIYKKVLLESLNIPLRVKKCWKPHQN